MCYWIACFLVLCLLLIINLSYHFSCSLADVEKRTQDTNMVGDQGAWRPYFTFVEHLRDKHAKNEVLHGVLNYFPLLTVLVFLSRYCA